MNKKIVLFIFIAIVMVFLVAFFWPKYCGNFAGIFEEGQTFKDCTCVGIKHYDPTGKPSILSLNKPYTKVCYGISVK